MEPEPLETEPQAQLQLVKLQLVEPEAQLELAFLQLEQLALFPQSAHFEFEFCCGEKNACCGEPMALLEFAFLPAEQQSTDLQFPQSPHSQGNGQVA